jgi:crotonobetaine/carnitine-CoA ligase
MASVDVASVLSLTLPDLVRAQAERFGQRRFIAFQQGTELSVSGLLAEGERVAGGLAAMGIGRGDRVILFMRNRSEFLTAMLAINLLGAVFVPINTELKGAFLQHQVEITKPSAIIAESDLAERLHADWVSQPGFRGLVILPRAGLSAHAYPPRVPGVHTLAFKDVCAVEGREAPTCPDLTPLETSCILFTSGTSGPAKGVMISHRHMLVFAWARQWR